jgi:membrane protease YdiL (CAAX protease family)
MNVSITALPNSKENIQERHQTGRISRNWPVIILFARLALAIIAQALVAAGFKLSGHTNPWQAAAPWWIVYGTLIDIGCLVFLARLTRREGIRLFDLISFQRQRLGRDLLIGLGFIVLYILLAMSGGIISDILIYGATPAPGVMVPLPLWGSLYSLIVWPLIWAFAEEMTYQGYALPRLEVILGKPWLAVLLVGFGWAIQHSAMPLMADWRWAVFRFASSLLIGMVLPIIYLRTRRLTPFIVGHWAANFAAVLMTVIMPQIAL